MYLYERGITFTFILQSSANLYICVFISACFVAHTFRFVVSSSGAIAPVVRLTVALLTRATTP